MKRCQRGNVIVLVLYQCLALLVATIFSLDVYSVLFARRAVQTAADSAAFGALRAVQNAIAPILYQEADTKVKNWFKEAREAWESAHDSWSSSQTAAQLGCLLPGAASGCYSDWLAANPEPKLDDLERNLLMDRIQNERIVDAILGRGAGATHEETVDAVLTGKDKMCILWQHRADLQDRATVEGRKYAVLNEASLVRAEVPFAGKAQVYVRVERSVPSLFLERFSAEQLMATGEASATVFQLLGRAVDSSEC